MMSDPHTRNPSSGGERRLVRPPMDRAGTQNAVEERERLLDEELDDTFPASDPPSWTMGGSVVSSLRH
jgi:hypothetical protein